MKRFKIGNLAAAAFLALFVGIGFYGTVVRQAIAQGMTQLTALVGTEQITGMGYPCTVSCFVTTGTVAGYARSTQLLFTTLVSSGDGSTTGEQTLASYALPANTLNVGTKLIVRASFLTASDGNNKTMKCYFGATSISSGAVADNNKVTTCQVVVTKTGASTQTFWASMTHDTTNITGVAAAPTETDTSAITIKATGTNGSAVLNEIFLVDFSVERLGT